MASIVAIKQDVYPPRVLVTIQGLTIGNSVSVYRVVAGQRTPVRAARLASANDTSYLVVDAELPFGVPVGYVAVVNNSAEVATSTPTYVLPGGKVALSDAVTGLSAEVVLLAAGDRVYDRESVRFRVGSRNVVVSGPWGQFEGTYDIFVESTSQLDNLMALLANATESVVQIRQPGGYDGVDAYVAVDRVNERRFSQDGSDERRVVTIQFAETEPWPDELSSRGYTLQDIYNHYGPTGTLNDISNDYPFPQRLLEVAVGDFS